MSQPDSRYEPVDGPVVVLYRGGRLPTWHRLGAAEREAAQRHHVDLMLSVGRRHGLRRIEGYQLLAPQGNWERWWTIEFDDLAGAEAWMAAEVEPPYGRYGYYAYDLARRWRPASLDWLPLRHRPPAPHADPHVVPHLEADRASVVLLAFGGWCPDSDEIAADRRGDAERDRRLRSVARDHGLLHGELYRRLGTAADGAVAWVLEFPDLAGAEAWVEAERAPAAGAWQWRAFHLARRWAPTYFANWPTPA